MPVPNVPTGLKKLPSRNKLREIFTGILLLGVAPTSLIGQERMTADSETLNQERLDAASGDIPVSPWSRRNNPTRSTSFQEEVSQPKAVPQSQKADSKSSEIRLGDSNSNPAARENGPAKIRWGVIHAPNNGTTTPAPSTSNNATERIQNTPERETLDPSIRSSSTSDLTDRSSQRSTTASRSAQEGNRPLKSESFPDPELSTASSGEPLFKPAANRSRTQQVSTVIDLGAPSTAIQQNDQSRTTSKSNSPIRIAPDDTKTVESVKIGERANLNAPLANSEQRVQQQIGANEAKRMLVAQRLSHELLSQNQAPMSRVPQPLEQLAGWQSIEQELRSHLDRCDQLLRRGAVHSARAEAITGLRRLYRTMDALRGSFASEPALDAALTAFREEADFHTSFGVTSVGNVVATHSTIALKNRPLDEVSPEVASQHYRVFARYQLVTASDGHRWASDMLYALGKTYEKEAEHNLEASIRLRSQAVVCYQSATHITPSQSEASNQLGYALIHLDRIEEAFDALTASIQSQPNAQAWSNLAEVYRRRGALDSAQYAVQQATSLSQQAAPVYSPENPEITQVDPAVFAKYSPAQNVTAPTTVSTLHAEATATPAAKQANFFSKMFTR